MDSIGLTQCRFAPIEIAAVRLLDGWSFDHLAYIRQVEKMNGEVRNVEIAKFENVKDPVEARQK